MPKERIEDLIPGVTNEDLLDDNGLDSVDVSNATAARGRMFTLY